jgi:hypothetical protein
LSHKEAYYFGGTGDSNARSIINMFLLHYAKTGFGGHPSSYMMALQASVVKEEMADESAGFHCN